MENLQLVSIVLEAVIVVLGLLIGIQKKKCYGYGLAVTFAVYVYYDLAKLFGYSFLSDLLYPLFFLATISALVSMWMIYKGK